jgi:hypothetical protein
MCKCSHLESRRCEHRIAGGTGALDPNLICTPVGIPCCCSDSRQAEKALDDRYAASRASPHRHTNGPRLHRFRFPRPEATGNASATTALQTVEADAMHSVLIRRADALDGCTKGSRGKAGLERIVDAIDAYGAERSLHGREPDGKG